MLKNSVMILRCLKISSPSSQIFFSIQTMKFDKRYFTMWKSYRSLCTFAYRQFDILLYVFLNSYSFVFCNTTRLNKHLILNNSSQKLKLNEQSLITQFIDVLCKQYTLYVVQVMADIAIILWAMHKMKT